MPVLRHSCEHPASMEKELGRGAAPSNGIGPNDNGKHAAFDCIVSISPICSMEGRAEGPCVWGKKIRRG